MPGMRCTVIDCNNSRINVDKTGKQISFYRFPKNKVLRQKWVEKCRRGGKWNPETCRVCSEHFSEEDYERNLQAELLNLPARKKLKATAVPSLKLCKEGVEAPLLTPKCEENEYIPEESSNLLVTEVLKEEAKDIDDYMTTEDINSQSSSSSHMSEENKYECLLKKYDAVVKENNEIKQQLQFTNEVNKNLMQKLNKVENDLANLTKQYILQNSHRI